MQFDKLPFQHKIKAMLADCETKIMLLTGHRVQLVGTVLKDDLESEMNRFVAEAATMLNIKYSLILSKTRNHKVVAARFTIAVGLTQRFPNATQMMIGKCVGYKDHSSVIHAREAVANMLKQQNVLYTKYYKIIEHFVQFSKKYSNGN